MNLSALACIRPIRIDIRKISSAQIDEAIRRAKKRNHPPCRDWPRSLGQTTVYPLVENILAARDKPEA
ncbi:hypothetical protein HW932_17175 [Allochromatium humboldtianum]|uniref:Uncharacterized protein n=1 Tax=Allochromatium humboldtianum TaxID=504901 RepID=A0A850RIR8_9GAMM|nr:hypothetical protein [Allochromatium humboldtianum]NVZ10992.1 hypothetical protein [Allochromatium humboldtianum]